MNLKKELPLIAIVLLPFIYLIYIYNNLPDQVPLHWNIHGEIDRYGSKAALIFIPIMLPLLVYVLFHFIPKVDPKNKLFNMGKKWYDLKFIFTFLMSILAVYILYSVQNHASTNLNFIIFGMGALFTALGNYFKIIRPNYFLGIRTPWTLEDEEVWKETHVLGGKLWFVGGLLIMLFSLILSSQLNLILCLTIAGIITLIPILYSYVRFQKKRHLI